MHSAADPSRLGMRWERVSLARRVITNKCKINIHRFSRFRKTFSKLTPVFEKSFRSLFVFAVVKLPAAVTRHVVCLEECTTTSFTSSCSTSSLTNLPKQEMDANSIASVCELGNMDPEMWRYYSQNYCLFLY